MAPIQVRGFATQQTISHQRPSRRQFKCHFVNPKKVGFLAVRFQSFRFMRIWNLIQKHLEVSIIHDLNGDFPQFCRVVLCPQMLQWSFEPWLELGSCAAKTVLICAVAYCSLLLPWSVPYLLGIYNILYWRDVDGHVRSWYKHFRIEFLWSFELVIASPIPHLCTHLDSLPRSAGLHI